MSTGAGRDYVEDHMNKVEQIADMMTRGTWTGRRSAQRLAVTWGWQPSRVVQLAAEVAAAPCPKAAERAAAESTS